MMRRERRWVVVAILVYLVAILLVQLLLNAPGRDVPFYAAIAAGTSLCSLKSSSAFRRWSVWATLVALALLVADYRAGVRFEQTVREPGIAASVESAAP